MGAETLRIALTGLVANRLRSGLTILGMAIGVGSVIILIAVGNGSSEAVQSQIRSLGTNVLIVLPSGGLRGGTRASTQESISLSKQDAEALQDSNLAPAVKSASPVVNASSVQLAYGSSSFEPASFIGTTPSYLSADAYRVESGESFNAEDISRQRRVLLIGQNVAEELGFGAVSPVGQTLKVNGSNFQIIGVLAPKGSNGTTNEDDVVIAPISTVQASIAGYGPLSSISIQAKSQSSLSEAEGQVSQILDERHHVRNESEPGFQVLNQGSLIETSKSTSGVFTTLLGAVAAISLLVAGIGVMNIMLVSVTERTREIGIRKAIGARRSDILTQFLAEALLVSLVGGIAGIGIGVLGSQFKIAGVQPQIAPWSVLVAFAAAALSGLVFGTYPAARAAMLRPIEALRFE